MKHRMPEVCLVVRAIAVALFFLCVGTSLTAQQSSVTADAHPVASPANPNVDVKIGSATSTSAFRVFNSTPRELLSVRGDGLIVLGGAAGSQWHPTLLPAFEFIDTAIAFGVDTDLHLASNAYESASGAWRYKTSDLAADFYLYKGGFGWRVAPAGTADSAFTWVSAMNLNNLGNLSIGPLAPVHRLDVSGSPSISGDSREVVGIYDTSPMATGVGGGIAFGGNFQTSGPIAQQFASIEGVKENGASGDYAGALAFNTRVNQGYPAERMRIDSKGYIGVGANAPRALLHLARNIAGGIGPELILENSANQVGDAEAITFAAYGMARAQIRSRVEASPYSGTIEFSTGLNNLTERMRITGAGEVGIGTIPNVGIRLHVAGNTLVAGNLHATGTITGTTVIATYQDVAEWVPAKSDMLPGTVVILNPEVNNEVMPSSDRYDVRVAGVVSHQPGLILGEAGDSKEQIATTGRVLVKVDATAAPIRIGNLLVTSDKPGMAMRSDAIEIQGRKFHQPGTIIGKALEPLAAGEGEILVLLSLQ